MAHTLRVSGLGPHPDGGPIPASRSVVLATAAAVVIAACLPLAIRYHGPARAGAVAALLASGTALAALIAWSSRGAELSWASVIEPLAGFLVTVYAMAALATGEDVRADILGLALATCAVTLAGFYDRRLRAYAVGGALAVVLTIGVAITTVLW